ncbi:hypothetical protein J437_LFUL012140 [Ladona fulva]|uniref:Oligopeptide transporter 1 n=1 Tax=Ladona fulva TaxID=123851 RepID=A0A8K0P3C0_LADFU|nr:hypothetical protein J437_LFUL012140 [Ladona fulva]
MKDIEPAKTPEETKKIKYPKSVFFIISNEFCERFSFYGMRTILSIYLRDVLLFTDDAATVIFHTFVMLCYFTPVFGAMIADSLLGKFRTIFYISIIYSIGNIVIALGSTPVLEFAAVPITMLALALIAAGTGGIKPCVSAFGGDQFVLPEQELEQKQFFSIFYFSINAGSLISTSLTPILRQDVKCLGYDTCYPLAFGVPAILMIISLVIFVMGKAAYRMKKPEGNVVLQTFGVMKHAMSQKLENTDHKKDHWLDYASDKFDQSIINDIKGTLRVLYLLLPLPVFWALFDQQGSRWTFQATRMDGTIGSFILKPDQMQVVNPLLILGMIPVFESFVYPLLGRCNLLKNSIPRIFTGGVLAAIAFVISAIVEIQLEPTYAIVPTAGEAQLRIFNGIPCSANVTTNIKGYEGPMNVPNLESWTLHHIDIKNNPEPKLNILMDPTCSLKNRLIERSLNISGGKAFSYLISDINNELKVVGPFTPDDVEKSRNGDPRIRILHSLNSNADLHFKNEQENKVLKVHGNINATEYEHLSPHTRYELYLGGNETRITEVMLPVGGVYTLMVIQKENGDFESKLVEVTVPNTVHMMWLLPQYIVITAGEIMFSITGLEFSFTQAPSSMKSVMQAAWLLTVAFGNLIVVIIAEAKFFESQTSEFFLFAGLMVAVMILFLFMARDYKYVQVTSADEEEQLEDFKGRKQSSQSCKELEVSGGKENEAFENPN